MKQVAEIKHIRHFEKKGQRGQDLRLIKFGQDFTTG